MCAVKYFVNFIFISRYNIYSPNYILVCYNYEVIRKNKINCLFNAEYFANYVQITIILCNSHINFKHQYTLQPLPDLLMSCVAWKFMQVEFYVSWNFI